MTLYHEVTKDWLIDILQNGLIRASRGKKGNDHAIIATDTYLDAHRPAWVVDHNISRDDALYAFIGTEHSFVDIRNGRELLLSHHPDPSSSLIRLAVDYKFCYVSDLDLYDELKDLITQNPHEDHSQKAAHYWASLVPLTKYTSGAIRRPEVIITTDIPPEQITVVNR